MNKAKRYNEGKPRWSLVPQSALLPMVKVLEFGAKKYGENNWKLGLNNIQVMESLKRHLDSLMEGQEIDKESNCSHIGHIQANALFLGYQQKEEENKYEGIFHKDIRDFMENLLQCLGSSYNEFMEIADKKQEINHMDLPLFLRYIVNYLNDNYPRKEKITYDLIGGYHNPKTFVLIYKNVEKYIYDYKDLYDFLQITKQYDDKT